MKKILFAGTALLLLSSCGQNPEKSEVPGTNPAAAYRFAEEQVAVGPRSAGSAGAEKLRKFLKKNFPASGLTEKYSVKLSDGREIVDLIYWYPRKPQKQEKFVIAGAHYDTKVLDFAPDFQGANDGASGVAALLAMIHCLQKTPPPIPVCFAFFDGEEALVSYSDTDGLHGSKLFAEILLKQNLAEDCAAMILLDMIGDKSLNVRFPADTDPDLLKKTLRLAGTDRRFAAGGSVMLDDHVPFQKIGIPAIDFIDFDYGPGNAFWHTRHDTLDKISGESIAAAANLALKLIWEISR